MSGDEHEPLWTAERTAQFLGCSVAQLYALRRAGRGPRCYRIDQRLRFAPADVRAWLEDHAEDTRG